MHDLDLRLHAYQVKALHHLWHNPRAGLFLDMGLGKTATVLQALTPDHLPALVIAPKRVTEKVWPTEIPKWRPDLSLAVAAGTPVKRAQALAQQADVTIISKENFGDIKRSHYRTIVLDELSVFKGRGSRWRLAKKLTKDTEHVWGLTGTPTPNGLLDLWAQMYLIDQGVSLGTTYGGYKSRYFRPGRQMPNGVVIEWLLREGAQEHIEQLISTSVLSMKAIDHLIDHQAPTINPIQVPLPPRVMSVYKKMKSDLAVTVDGTAYTAKDGGALFNRLCQITSGFLYPDADEPSDPTAVLHRESLSAALEVIEGASGPVLVFYRYEWERKALLDTLPGVREIDEPGVLGAWDRGEVPVLLAHPASAGHGLNLQYGGHTILWYSMPNVDLELWQQGNARLARQGQEHPVVVHVLVSPDTIDEWHLTRLEGKAEFQEGVMDAIGWWSLI